MLGSSEAIISRGANVGPGIQVNKHHQLATTWHAHPVSGDDFSTDVKISQPKLERYACARLYNENQRNRPTYY